ncbi:hypothetical protein EJB05_37390, partial [Eragrostis curvula]
MSHPPRAAAGGGGKLHPLPASAHLPHRPLSIASPLASACIHRFATRPRPLLAYTACRRSDPPFAAQVHFSPPRRATSPPSWLPIRYRPKSPSPSHQIPKSSIRSKRRPMDHLQIAPMIVSKRINAYLNYGVLSLGQGEMVIGSDCTGEAYMTEEIE